jgi:hypothetical protein
MFVPGLQPVAAGMGAVNAAANGDPAGAVMNVAGLMNPGASTGAQTAGAPAITATGNPAGGVSAVSNAGIAQPNASLANTFSKILRGGQGATSVTPGVNRWQDVMQSDPRWMRMMSDAIYGARRTY